MAEMRSPVMATSARIQGLPLPSTILAPVMRVSKWVGMGSGRGLGGRNDYLSLDGMRVVATEFKATFFIVVLNQREYGPLCVPEARRLRTKPREREPRCCQGPHSIYILATQSFR